MEIQNIPGFKLARTSIIGSPPSSRFTRGRGGSTVVNRWRAPAEVKTLDFGAGLEAYIPPRVLQKRPHSSRDHQRRRSKETSSQDKEIQFDVEKQAQSWEPTIYKSDTGNDLEIRQSNLSKDNNESWETTTNVHNIHATTFSAASAKEKESDFHRLANTTYQEWTDSTLNVFPTSVSVVELVQNTTPRHEFRKKDEEAIGILHIPAKVISPCSSVGQNESHTQLVPGGKEARPPRSPQQWFEKTLQEYEDLKKSVDAQISSAPSSINERVDIAADLKESDNRVGAIWAEFNKKDAQAFSDVETSKDQTSDLDDETDTTNARTNQLCRFSSEVPTKHLMPMTRKEVGGHTNMLREGRPLWERPEHATGKYLIHGTSPFSGLLLTSNGEKKFVPENRIEKKRSGVLTTYSCGCSPSQQVLSPPLTTYSCGCSPKLVIPRPSCLECLSQACQYPPSKKLTTLSSDEAMVDKSAWKQMVETIAHLREVNKGLQLTIEDLTRRERKPPSSSSKLQEPNAIMKWHLHTKENFSGVGLLEPEMRKQVVSTLRNSVDKMQNLVHLLKEEQLKSTVLSKKLSGFLANKDNNDFHLLGPSPSHGGPLMLPPSTIPKNPSGHGHQSPLQIHQPPCEDHMISLGVDLTLSQSQPPLFVDPPPPLFLNREKNNIISRSSSPSTNQRPKVGVVFSI